MNLNYTLALPPTLKSLSDAIKLTKSQFRHLMPGWIYVPYTIELSDESNARFALVKRNIVGKSWEKIPTIAIEFTSNTCKVSADDCYTDDDIAKALDAFITAMGDLIQRGHDED
ncbi:hypothetical protein [Rappaport israeli]|uniref:hypothetical protein n=1 Tax=Rappaport israeli TaxID=1839807 RepID=UPI00093006C4|nr:hypothetical protein [Rappaport israeli]